MSATLRCCFSIHDRLARSNSGISLPWKSLWDGHLQAEQRQYLQVDAAGTCRHFYRILLKLRHAVIQNQFQLRVFYSRHLFGDEFQGGETIGRGL